MSSAGTVYLKPNGIHFTPHAYTHPSVIAPVLAFLRDHGYTRLALMENLRRCAELGLGEGRLDQIDVQGIPLSRFAERAPHELLRRFHSEGRWLVGRSRACIAGCRGNSECIQQMLYNDYGAKGGWTLVCGSGFEAEDVDGLPGDILVIGPCACSEVAPEVRKRDPARRILEVPEPNGLMANTHWQARLMGVAPLRMVPLNPILSAWTLLQARLHVLQARVPPLFG